jgi:DNA (cytosine-5)-methyltransferase 1
MPKLISLFSGCGGFDLGFKKAGFEIIFSNDIEKNLKETYEKNLKHPLIIKDIRQLNKDLIPQADVLIAGIPCQPFSNAGNRKSTKEKKPKVVIFENVRGFLSSKDEKGKLLTDRLKMEMKKIGYNSKFKLLNASDYGVPSNRFRVFIVCIRDDIKKEYFFPLPDIMKTKLTVGDIISKSLPKNEKNEIWDLSDLTLKSVKFIKEGGSWKDIPDQYLSNAHKNIDPQIFIEDFQELK